MTLHISTRAADNPFVKRVALLVAVSATLAAQAATAVAAGRDTIRIIPPGVVVRNTTFDLTIVGRARHRAVAFLFVDYLGCAPTLAAELRRDARASDRYVVDGAFAELSGWVPPSAGTDYACAYLVSHGVRLASARLPVTVR